MFGTKTRVATGYRVFSIINQVFLISMALFCILPLINVLAISLSSPVKAAAGMVKLWPVDFTTEAYRFVLKDRLFWSSMGVSLQRVVLGTSLSLFITIIASYALSKDSKIFPARKYYVWYIFFTMLFSGGLIPGFLTVYYTGLMDSIWALIIPGAVAPFNIILMLNFFRQLPKELEEAAYVDGAGHFKILWQVFVPISKPAIATVALFTMVGHWNSWFDGMLYMMKADHYPLQTYLQSLITVDVSKFLNTKEQALMTKLSPKTLRAAQIFIGAFPILVVYPFLQKYFTKGLVLGSVKG